MLRNWRMVTDRGYESMVVEMVPLKGGLGGIVHPPIGSIYHLYTTYSPCLRLGVKNATDPTF